MSRRVIEELNAGLTTAFEERDDVYLIGEDLLDPYGGAFKASKGLSSRWPERVITTPISEASLMGVAAGMSMRGLRPVLEIMFGDFVTLGYDQIVNGISKYREMYNDQVTIPMVVRTPMGGRRGYGPTHSQSLEKLLMGVPNIRMVAPSEYHDVGGLLRAAINDDEPVFFVENKLMYGRMNRRPQNGRIEEFSVRETAGPYPALTLSANDFGDAEVTIATYGGMLPIAIEAATELVLEHEVFCEVVVLSSLLPLDVGPVADSIRRTGALVTAEEGSLTAGIGAELVARATSDAWEALRAPARRIAADDGIIPSAPGLEDQALPGADAVRDVVLGLAATTA